MNRVICAALAAVITGTANARMPAEPNTYVPTAANAAAVADASQMQAQGQHQGQGQIAASSATTGDTAATGQGGDGGDARQGQSIAVTGARQVGMLYLPTMIPPACGAAISAGHSNTRNATAGGISWTTERCWSVVIAQDFERMGAYREACELRRDVVRKQAKRAGIAIDCDRIERDMRAAIAAAAIVPPSEPAADYATREELRRAFEAAMGKGVLK